MKIVFLALGASLLTSLSAQAQQFTPIAVSNYNSDMIVGIGETVGANQNATTQTIDGGNANDTFYTIGYNSAAPTTGIPAGGTFTALTGAGMFSLAAADVNNAWYKGGTILLTGGNTRYSSLALLGCSGNSGDAGGVTFTINYADGTTQTTAGNQGAVLDWFSGNTAARALSAMGRVNVGSGSLDNVNQAGVCNLNYSVIALTNTTSAVRSVVINNGTANSEAIFALSGVALVPEPSSMFLLSGASLLAAFAWVRTRRAPKLS